MTEHPSPEPSPGSFERWRERRRRHLLGLTPKVALGWIAFIALAVAMIGALLVFLLDEGAFGSFGEALWWSIVTVGTVGYGDVVPTNGAGRVVAAIMIVFTMAFFPVLTGVVTASLIDKGGDEASADDDERQDEVLEMLRSIDDRLSRLEGRVR